MKKEAYLLLWDAGKEGFSIENAVTIKTVRMKVPTIFTIECKTIIPVLSMPLAHRLSPVLYFFLLDKFSYNHI
ncbi:MAG: hypothetical protein ACLQF0_02910 [Dissulfurispiraceae bacterium]